jgi:hypothetical protein
MPSAPPLLWHHQAAAGPSSAPAGGSVSTISADAADRPSVRQWADMLRNPDSRRGDPFTPAAGTFREAAAC